MNKLRCLVTSLMTGVGLLAGCSDVVCRCTEDL